MPRPNTDADFWTTVRKTNGCWLWVGTVLPGSHPYGRFTQRSKTTLAHRWAYESVNGAIPDGLVVMHTCDNPRCVRPDHLRVGTQKENVRDMWAKGRFVRQSGERNPNAKLSAATVEQIREHRKTHLLKETAACFGVSRTTVSRIYLGRLWKTI